MAIKPKTPIDELLYEAQKILGTRSKTETIKRIGTTPCSITRIRLLERIASPEFILKFHDATGISIEEIRRIGKIPKLL